MWKEGIHPLGENQDSSPNSSLKKRRLETKSFFKWFRDNTDPLTDDTAEIFKDDIWNNPLQYYLVPDIESNDAVSSPSDSSDTEEPRRRDKTEHIATKISQNSRTKSIQSTNINAVSDIALGSNSAETRTGDMSTCEVADTEAGNAGDGESETEATGASGQSSSTVQRRRIYMSGDYG